MQTGETLIEVKDLCKHFRDGTVKALDGVDLTIRKGDVIVIIGPSGSGKTTLCNLIARFWDVQEALLDD